jgi:1-acyl-sn-glycerol-3-phosphate acyltransferase
MPAARAILRFIAFILLTLLVFFLRMVLHPLAALFDNVRLLREALFKAWSKGFVRLMGMRITVIGTPPKPPFFLVSNHLGYADIPALRSVLDCVFVAKGDIKTWPVAGTIVSSFGTIYVDRNNRRDIPRAGEKILETLARGEGVVVFPEGTSWNGKEILKFNSSFLHFAARSKLAVHYSSISYRAPAGWPPASESVAWWKMEDTFGGHLMQLFRLPHFDCTITFGEYPIYSMDRKELAGKLRGSVVAQFETMD